MFRPNPMVPVEFMKTYAVVASLETHYRKATCEEVECLAMARGWKTVLDESDARQKLLANYIRNQSGRRFEEYREGGVVTFMFPAGQTCFQPHHISLDRPANYLVKGGDWRGNPTGTRTIVHRRPEDWVEDFAEHQMAVAERVKRG